MCSTYRIERTVIGHGLNAAIVRNITSVHSFKAGERLECNSDYSLRTSKFWLSYFLLNQNIWGRANDVNKYIYSSLHAFYVSIRQQSYLK